MNCNYLLLYLLGISSYFLAVTVAREAIIHGNKVKGNPLTYHVAVSIVGRGYVCGGGIIGDEFILSAASCIVGRNGKLLGKPISIHAGTNDLGERGIVIEVETVFVPKAFKRLASGTSDDIAVLKLIRPLNLRKNHKLMRLSRPGSSAPLANKTAIIAGFGWNWIEIKDHKQNGGHTDTYLRYAEVDILSHQQCEHDHPHLCINKKQFCARVKQYDKTKARGVCVGDGGGPLVARGRTVVGIFTVSKFGCSEKNSSGLYVGVSHYRYFIDNAMKNKETNHMISIYAL